MTTELDPPKPDPDELDPDEPEPSATDPDELDPQAFRRDLLAFYDRERRDLPWRRTMDPFHIWVSEIMLQQTRVETVIPYWERWVERFPTVEAFADADLDEILPMWEGLGYYSRARNLHHAARLVRDDHGGRIPRDREGLERLPGVGAYTAGAVASIAFGQREAVVDGNVRRVLSRLFDLEDPNERDLWRLATELVDRERPGDHNQALMELGATVCSPRQPECARCPVRAHCLAHARATVDLRPPPRKRSATRKVHFVSLVLTTPSGRTLLARRPDDGLLARLWEFPSVEVETPPAGSTLSPVQHAFSHIRATYHPLVVHAGVEPTTGREALAALRAGLSEIEHGAGPLEFEDRAEEALRVTDGAQVSDLTLPVAQRKILEAWRARSLED